MDEYFKVSILASSSQGNSTLIETGKTKILVDAGLSGKKITEALQKINVDITDINAILVTHEHSDHIQGVGVLSRKYDIPIFANEKTWEAMSDKIGKVTSENQFIFGENSVQTFNDLDVESFEVSHDAASPQFYQMHYNGKSFAILTDTGYVSERITDTIKNADGYLLECNHDMEMLRNGSYSWSLKQRIIGDRGHLSNVDGAATLENIIGNKTKKIFLGHLSPENNKKLLARNTVTHTLQDDEFNVGNDFEILDTDINIPTNLYNI